MLYYLALLKNSCGPLRLFDYVTFRAGGAAATAFFIVLLLGAPFARMLRNLNLRAADRYDGLIPPELLDKRKNSTPCMGGVLMLASIVISSLLWLRPSSLIGWILVGGTTLFGALGFVDDALKVFRQDRDGLPEKPKLAGQFLIAAIAVCAFCFAPETSVLMKNFYIPFLKTPLFSGSWLIPAFSVLAIAVMVNAVNFTDGKDGLASGCTIFCSFTFAVFTYLMGHKIFANYLDLPFISGIEEAVVFAFAICGCCIGFLWHNCHPAAMFMGDTGSLALGGAISLLAVLVRQELLMFVVGGVFSMEFASVVLQRYYYKMTKKRIFLCSPIHHHFERLGWTETQIVVRFWILSGLFAMIALGTLKLR